MRGTGEGSRPYDLKPNSTMTNATVAESVVGNDGHTLLIKYKDGEKKVVVSPETPVVTYVPGDKSDLKPGAKVIAFMKKLPDGSLRDQPRQRRPRRPHPADVTRRFVPQGEKGESHCFRCYHRGIPLRLWGLPHRQDQGNFGREPCRNFLSLIASLRCRHGARHAGDGAAARRRRCASAAPSKSSTARCWRSRPARATT